MDEASKDTPRTLAVCEAIVDGRDPSYGRFSAEAVSLPLALCAAYCAARAGIEEGCAI